ncbi:hypothetical protein N1F78_15545 [Seonamhaeicola sp. MEBiC1930]|uniref:hypothetical protein n=1 Tax=Seonamhaeicola sp. MEBiC01930 TaxID=2976768 RepID=UPI0032433D48
MKTIFVKTTLILFVALISTSCISTKNYVNRINTWKGHDVNNLISAWGPPSNVYELPNGSKMYTYLYVNNSLVKTRYNEWADETYQTSSRSYCQTSFTANTDGIIVSTAVKGPSCYSFK